MKNFLQYPPLPAGSVIKVANAVLLAAMIACCLGCGNGDKKVSHNQPEATATQKTVAPMSFLDSIAAQIDLNFGQIKKHTIIGQDYFDHASNGSATRSPSFTGDTVYYPASKHPLIIITYSDTLAVCMRKLLLVYDGQSLKNTDYHLVEQDWDVDYSSDDTQTQFKVVNNNLFYVDEIYTQRKGREHQPKDKQTTRRQYFKITADGKIEPLPKKTISVELVDKDESEL